MWERQHLTTLWASTASYRDTYPTHTRFATTSSYRTTADLHKSPQYPLSLFQPTVFTSRSLVTASNSGHSSASALKSFLDGGSPLTDLFAPLVFLITPRHDRAEIFRSRMHIRCAGKVFTKPFSSSGRLVLLTMNLLPSNGRRSFVSRPLLRNECCFRAAH
jgi:hypothetical protein